MIEVTVDFASFEWSPICACDLPFSYIDIIIDNVSDECSRLEVLGMEGMITIGLVVVEKCKVKLIKIFLCSSGNGTYWI